MKFTFTQLCFRIAKLQTVGMAVGEKLPHFCQQAFHWLLSFYNTSHQEVLPLTIAVLGDYCVYVIVSP